MLSFDDRHSPPLKTAKTRSQIAAEFGISRKTLYNWLKDADLVFPRRLLSIKEQEKIYQAFGCPFDLGKGDR